MLHTTEGAARLWPRQQPTGTRQNDDPQRTTRNVMRAVVGFATTHTVKDHHLCRPHCTETCADAMTAVDCGLLDMCREDTTLADSCGSGLALT